ncbi:ABC transporter permease [Paenibacillus filicis]|uniref:ABC transporter permease n=1 Tax=Paenibacillus filicis TaxID=669464 RepID=A0ABU9DGR7_9BACL
MTFRQFALSQMKGNRHRYSAFFFSSVFAVMIFFVYAAFLLHPEVRSGRIWGGQMILIAMIACEIIIAIFAFFFVLYSCSAFLKSRQKEFGLLKLFGFTNSQIRRIVIYENLAIALLSMGTGIGLGLLFNRLFYMLISDMLQMEQPLRFYIPTMAALLTAGGYLVIFLLITLISMRHATRLEISELMVASRKPKPFPRFSLWLVLLSALCLGTGYTLAYQVSASTILLWMLPVIGLVVLGTHYLFTQSSVALLTGLQANKAVYYRSTHLILISQLAYKLKDNARILATVSVLCAVILTASGALNTLLYGMKGQLMERHPQTIGFHETGVDAHTIADPEDIRRILQEDGVQLEYEIKLIGLPLEGPIPEMQRTVKAMAISVSDYNALAARLPHMKPLEADYGHAWFFYPYFEMKKQFVQPGQVLDFQVNGASLQLTMNGQKYGEIAKTPFLFVLNDRQYAELASTVPDELKPVAYGFELKNWEEAGPSVERIAQLVPSGKAFSLNARTADYLSFKQVGSLSFFIGMFISVLFFVASGSLIFFKLFTEVDEDRTQLQALRRIGLTHGEINRIVSWQIATLFYLPCVVGAVHTAFAMKALSNLFRAEVWLYGGVVLLVYLVLQTGYFWLAKQSYFKKVVQPL